MDLRFASLVRAGSLGLAALGVPLCACDRAALQAWCMGVRGAGTEYAAPAPAAARSPIDWENLRNPILSGEQRIKDQTVVHHEGVFHLFGGGHYTSRDLRHWEGPEPFDAGSPELVRMPDGRFLLVDQGPDPASEEERHRRLRWRVSRDLFEWSPPRELAPELPHDRNIDGALAFANRRVVLGFKQGVRLQQFLVAESPLPDEAGAFAWSPVRKADAGAGCGIDAWVPDLAANVTRWAENFQFLEIDGRWRMVATARHPERPIDPGYVGSHEPFLYTMDGDGSKLEHWTRWVDKRHLQIPEEGWNRLMHANTATLSDWRGLDGHFYLFYSGADELDPDGRGHGSIGVARSRDLVHWEVPGGPAGGGAARSEAKPRGDRSG